MLGDRLAGFTYMGQAEHVKIRVYQNTKFHSNMNQGVSYISSVSIVLSVGLVSIVGISCSTALDNRTDVDYGPHQQYPTVLPEKQSYIYRLYFIGLLFGSTILGIRTDVNV